MRPSPALVATGALCVLLLAVSFSHSGHASAHHAASHMRSPLPAAGPRRPLRDQVFVPVGPPAVTLDQAVARLGRQAPGRFDRVRERYRRAGDLYQFMTSLLPGAESGERAHEFYVYLSLGQCQTYLRLEPDEARALNDRMLLELDGRPFDERRLWSAEFQRCRGFAGGDLSELKAAMGEDMPGAEVEYASIWFQRAADAGYPPALAEGALRLSMLSRGERVAMLEEAVASGDPEVSWQLFFHSPVPADALIAPPGMAWLLDACRAGYDCTPDAEWFRDIACTQAQEHCVPDESAIEHYWRLLAASEREQAWRLAERIAHDRAAGRYDAMPWPALSGRNIVEQRSAEGSDAS